MTKLEPRYYQKEAVDALFEYFNLEDAGNPIIELPTGSGKSKVQSMIAERIMENYPFCRILFLTHQSELIKQNFEELIKNMGVVDAGIYSAGLNCRDTDNKIIFAGIQSVYKKHLELGCFNLIVVDECHLISRKAEGMYRTFIDNMIKQAPYCKIVGLTATPYRLDSGLIYEGEGKIFDEVVYRAHVGKLIKEGYLCELIGKNGIVKPDLNGLHIRGGDYVESELNERCDNSDIISRAVSEIIELTKDRKKILLFCSGISHSDHVAEEMTKQGLECFSISSKNSTLENDRIIQDFREGKIRAVTNCEMLTTGFNSKDIDCIILLRPTKSIGLYYQMCGRGLRKSEHKKNCLILDYAGLILEHGPIDKIEIVDSGFRKEKGVKKAPMKECPSCGTPVHLSTVICKDCGYEWPVNLKHDETAADVTPLSQYKPPMEYYLKPEDTSYYVHEKNGQLSMKVTYSIALMDSVSEWICIEHGGFAEQKARQWMRNALPSGYPIPDTVEECLELKDIYKKPEIIFVDYNQRFPRVLSRIYYEEQEEERSESVQIINKSFVR